MKALATMDGFDRDVKGSVGKCGNCSGSAWAFLRGRLHRALERDAGPLLFLLSDQSCQEAGGLVADHVVAGRARMPITEPARLLAEVRV